MSPGAAATYALKIITFGVVNDGAWDGEDSIPPAPVPRHEREWRHPSELGRPELVTFETRSVGKGALVVAGLTGVALSLVLGRMLIPSGGDTTAQNSEPASTSASAALATPVTPSSRVESTTVNLPEPTPSVSDAVEPTTPPTLPATTEVAPDPVTEPSLVTLSAPEPSIAASIVSVGSTDHLGVLWNGRYAITTPGAGDLGTSVSLLLADGSTLDSIVVAEDAGLVLLELVEPTQADEMSTAWPPAGTARYIGADGSFSAVEVVSNPDGRYSLYDGAVAEGRSLHQGAPVVDSHGRFIGMCIPGLDGTTSLVSWTPVEALIDRADQLGAWLGIRSGLGPDGSATVAEIAPGAPAEVAGMLVGDVVTTIDGHSVGSLRQLSARLRVISPGTTVTVTVLRSGREVALAIATIGRPKATTTVDG